MVMGIVNVTPDSFSGGGRYLDAHAAVEYALQMAEDGAELLDIGGESTRPYATPVSAEEEAGRRGQGHQRTGPALDQRAPRQHHGRFRVQARLALGSGSGYRR